jgi:hypothetical protein
MPRRLLLPLITFAVLATSCGREDSPVAPSLPAVPSGAYSPTEAARLVEWAWKNRNVEVLDRILTSDYGFQFANGDSVGNAYRAAPFAFEDELLASAGLFLGAADHPAAGEILLDFDKELVDLSDGRQGKNTPWHRSIRTKVNLKVTLDRGNGPEVNEIGGYALFYVVRGDSASLSPTQVAAGGGDPTRWWIERWEDETLPPGATSANPTENRTWGSIKVFYR